MRLMFDIVNIILRRYMKVLNGLVVSVGLLMASYGAVASPISSGMKADLVVVKKSQFSLTLMKNGKPLRQFWIALGRNPRGTKTRQGDFKTPEGRYLLDYKKDRSNFHKAIHISYPNLEDLHRAKSVGEDPGSMVMIHGQPNYASDANVQRSDWTNGCIALLNQDMDQLWDMVDPGTPIEIYP